MILVTGPTGTVGTELVRRLIQMGERPRIFLHNLSHMPNLDGAVEYAEGDLDCPETILPALDGIDRIFLLTYKTEQDRHVIQAAKMSQSVQRIVKLSTAEASLPPQLGEDAWYQKREQLLRDSGLDWTFIRPTMFMSDALQWAGTIQKDQTVYFPGGSSQFAPIDPQDIAAVACATLLTSGHSGKAYELTGPELISPVQMVAVLSQAMEHDIRYVDVPEEKWGEQMKAYGAPVDLIDGLIETFRLMRQERFAHLSSDCKNLTGQAPHTFAQWCQAHYQLFTKDR